MHTGATRHRADAHRAAAPAHGALAIAVAASVALAPACTLQRRGLVTGAALHATMRERQASGTSEVPGVERFGDGEPKPATITVVRGHRLYLDGQPLDVDVLEEGCPADPAAASADTCALTRLATTVEAYSYRERHLGTTAKIGFGVAAAGLASAALCTGLCAGDSFAHTASRDVLIGSGVVLAAAAIGAGFFLLILRSSGT